MINRVLTHYRIKRFPLYLFLFLSIAVATSVSARAQFLFVTAPAANADWLVDSTYHIKFFASGITGTVNVEYSIDSGATWTRIDTTTATAGTDSIAWKVPNTPSTKAYVRVITIDSRDSGKSGKFIISKGLVPVITVTRPRGGEIYQYDSLALITWTEKNVSGTVIVEHSVDSGKTWLMDTSLAAANGTDSLRWKIPHTATTGGKIRVRTQNDSALSLSAGYFTIKSVINPKITVTFPNGGEVFRGGDTVFVRWSLQDIAGTINYWFSADSGKTWTQINRKGAVVGNDSARWVVTNTTTTRALVRVMWVNPNSITDTVRDVSDNVFTINAKAAVPSIKILYPTGGQKFKADSLINIRWQAANDTPAVFMVYYSTDSGKVWILIDSLKARNGLDTLKWKVPNDSSTSAAIAVVNSTGKPGDTLKVFFTILPKPGSSVAEQGVSSGIVQSLRIYPNPSSGSTEFAWTQLSPGTVTIRIYMPDGTIAAEQRAGQFEPGEHRYRTALTGLPSGAYLVEVEGGGARSIGRLNLVR